MASFQLAQPHGEREPTIDGNPTSIICQEIMTTSILLIRTTYDNTVPGDPTLVLCSQTAFLVQGVIACSISAPTKKGLVWFA